MDRNFNAIRFVGGCAAVAAPAITPNSTVGVEFTEAAAADDPGARRVAQSPRELDRIVMLLGQAGQHEARAWMSRLATADVHVQRRSPFDACFGIHEPAMFAPRSIEMRFAQVRVRFVPRRGQRADDPVDVGRLSQAHHGVRALHLARRSSGTRVRSCRTVDGLDAGVGIVDIVEAASAGAERDEQPRRDQVDDSRWQTCWP